MALLPHLELATGPLPDASVIWLHGLGADGHDFEPVVPALGLPEDLQVRFIFPHAPSMPVTVNGGYVMPAWYDILEINIERDVDLDQLCMSAERIQAFIERETDRGIDSDRIVVAGFSQGGAVAYEAALTYPEPLAGLLGLSTYFATAKTISIDSANSQLPIQLMHGIYDPVVPEQLGRLSVQALTDMGFKPGYKTYPMEHAVCPEEIADISRWLQGVLQ